MIKGRENPQDTRIKDNMERISYKIAVVSGKGGVGKTTLSINIAYALALKELRVGVMDVDIHGPNMPKMLGIESARFTGSEEEIEPVEIMPNLLAASVGNIGYDPDAALIWRGPMKIGIIKQFLGDVRWGDLDYLVIDTPPGTGDEVLSIGQDVHGMSGIVIVTTPQQVAILDARKSVDFAAKMDIPVIGVVENMADSETLQLFGSGGGEAAAETLGVPFLGRVSVDPRVVGAGDGGRPFVQEYAGEPAALQLDGIVTRIVEFCKGVSTPA